MEAKRAGMRPLVIDKGCLCNSIYNYPVNMFFFTTPELLEIGNLPMVCGGEKPTRTEALKYYRKGAEHYAPSCPSTCSTRSYSRNSSP